MHSDWSSVEVTAIVADYFAMLRAELMGQAYNKAEHRRGLLLRLNNRSDGAVERKHQNISAVLTEMGIPSINGYKPLYNYQRAVLPDAVDAYLMRNLEMFDLFRAHADLVPTPALPVDFSSVLVEPPVPESSSQSLEPRSSTLPGRMNYLATEARNARIGDLGEHFVLTYERHRLIHSGKEQLADRIEQVSETRGPVAGYDIRSFDENGQDRFIEVKATKYGKYTPFFVTPNELAFSQAHASRYFVYRVFQLTKSPRLFMLSGAVDNACQLAPSEYVARLG